MSPLTPQEGCDFPVEGTVGACRYAVAGICVYAGTGQPVCPHPKACESQQRCLHPKERLP